MKAQYLILFALLLSLYNCEDCGSIEPEKASNCHDNKKDGYHCCYFTIKTKNTKTGSNGESFSCGLISDDNYKKIEDYIKDRKKEIEDGQKNTEVSTYKIDCSSNYIIYSLLSLILLFL